MISFTDPRIYAKGTCSVVLRDVDTENVVYQSNKFTTANIASSVTMGEIRAGLGNAIAAIIPSDSSLEVNFEAADFNLWAKAAQLGATYTFGAPIPTCQIVTANSSSLTVDVSANAPVAQLGYSEITCNVQQVGVSGTLAATGAVYPIDPETGVVTGFTATSGNSYRVWYFIQQPNAQIASISTNFDPKVVHMTAQIAVYANENGGDPNGGTRCGWLYVVVPRLKLGGNGGIVGDQSNNDTTSISGQAIAYDPSVVQATCTDCDAGTLAYYVYSPDSQVDNVTGVIGALGGVISVQASQTSQVQPRLILGNGQLVVVSDYSQFEYELSGAPSGTTVSATGLITAGETAGDCTLTVSYPADSPEFSDTCDVSVVSA